jgi:hypothetical protein
VLEDFRAAPIREPLRATLELVRKMTLEPAALGPADVRAVLAQGVSRQALEDALQVAYLFNIYDRLADSMGWEVPANSSGYYEVAARRLLTRGYQ